MAQLRPNQGTLKSLHAAMSFCLSNLIQRHRHMDTLNGIQRVIAMVFCSVPVSPSATSSVFISAKQNRLQKPNFSNLNDNDFQ